MTKIDINASKSIAKLATMTKSEVQQVKANAEARGEWKVVKACLARLAELASPRDADPLVRRFLETITATEELLHARLSRTRQKYTRLQHSSNRDKEIVKEIMSELMMRKTPAKGFLRLMELGAAELTLEAVVLEFAEEFPAEIVTAARERLRE